MIYTTFKTVVITFLTIFIIHLFIRYLLINSKNRKRIISSIEDIDNSISEIDEKDENKEDKIIEGNDTRINLDKMKEELQNYILNNKQIYENTEKEVENNKNCTNISPNQFISEKSGIDKYFNNMVNTNDIALYTEPQQKQKYIDTTPQIDMKTNPKMGEQGWEKAYTNESIMNGGEISGGLCGYDSLDNNYASL